MEPAEVRPPGGAESASGGGDYWDRTWQDDLAGRGQALQPRREYLFEDFVDQGKLEFVRPDLPPHGRVVEVGCGSARLLARVAAGGRLEGFALDRSGTALRLTRTASDEFRVPLRQIQADVSHLPLQTGTFDVVLSGGLLEHFEDPRPVLREMVRVLRPGGLFYADIVPRRPSLYRLHELRRMLRSAWFAEGVYESSFGAGAYRTWLAELGCTAIRTRHCGVYPSRGRLRIGRRTTLLDGTVVARALGWYFMVAARKA